MWVWLEPWLIGDRRFPAVCAGQQVRAALEFSPVDPQPTSLPEPALSHPGGSIAPFPLDPARLADAQYRVQGTVALEGNRQGITAGGLFLKTDNNTLATGTPVDLIGPLSIAMDHAIGGRLWVVNQIVLHMAPIMLLPGVSSRIPDYSRGEQHLVEQAYSAPPHDGFQQIYVLDLVAQD